jgi:flagellar protein FliS
MVMSNAYERYKTQNISTASPMALIVMLYNGCIKQLKLSRIAIEKKDYEGANNSLKKSQDIITELMMSLDFRYEISNNLMALYRFIYGEIVSINMAKKVEKIEPVVKILSDLREAWVKVEKEYRPQSYEISELEQ